MIKQLIEKVMEKPDKDTRIKLVYMWIKQDHINLKTSIELLNFIYEADAAGR